MELKSNIDDMAYRDAMGRLLVLYTQIDYLIMCACAERIPTAPDEDARLSLAKQVGDEFRHVSIQQEWVKKFEADPTPVISREQEERFLQHFRSLSWLDFLTDMYVCVEALGSEAVEQVVPLADPGTRQSLETPLQDEADHVAFGLRRLRQALAALSERQRITYIESISARLDYLDDTLHGMSLNIPSMFEAVGVDYQTVVDVVMRRRQEVLHSVAFPLAA